MDERVDFGRILGDGFDLIKRKPYFLIPLTLVALLSILLSNLTAPYIAQKTAGLQNSVIDLSQNRPLGPSPSQIVSFYKEMGDFFINIALLVLVSIVIVGFLSILLITGLVVGLKGVIIKGGASLGEMFSGAFNYGFYVFISEIVAALIVFWPFWLMLFFGILAFLTFNIAFAALAVIMLIALIVWSIIITYWISRILGLIYLIFGAITLTFFILGLVAPVLQVITILFLFFLIMPMLTIWGLLCVFTISNIIPPTIIFEGKQIIGGAKKAFEFTRDFTAELGVLILIILVIALLFNLPIITASALNNTSAFGNQALYTHQPSNRLQMTQDMFYSPGTVVINAISEVVNTAILGTYFALVFALLFAYGRGFKKLPGKPKVVGKPTSVTPASKPPKYVPPSSPSQKSKLPKWKCSSCGSENNLKDKSCWMCGAEKK
jgi:hypothetical protein